MSRTLSVLALTGVAFGVVLLPQAAYAADLSSGNCALTLAAAETANTLNNGPVHDNFGVITVGDFTPATYVAGTTAPVGPFVTCAV